MAEWSPLSSSAADGVEVAFGEDGAAWAAGVGDRFRDVAGELGLTLGEALVGGLLSAVCAATGPDGRELVVKAACDPADLAREVAALQAWHEHTPGVAAEVVWSAPDVVVLERVVPGHPVRPVGAGDSLEVEVEGLAPLVRAISTTAAADDTVAAEVERLAGAERSQRRLVGALDAGLVPEAPLRSLLGGLDEVVARLEGAEGRGPRRWCHGDLWTNNVLEGPSGWTMIDPYPMAGRVESDVALWAVVAGWGGRLGERLVVFSDAFSLDHDALVGFARFSCIERAAIACAYGIDPDFRVPRLAVALESLRD